MKKEQIKTGKVYRAKVTDKIAEVRIDKAHDKGGWHATNLATNRKVHIKSAARLRSEVKPRQPKKTTKDKPAPATKPAKKMSLVSAAIKVMGKAKEPMNVKQIMAEVEKQKLWSPRNGGKTPGATLYSAMLREINHKGDESRFVKVDRGQFTVVKGA